MTEVNGGKFHTILEHQRHIRHFVRNEVLHALYLRHVRQSIIIFFTPSSKEHTSCRSKMRIPHRGIYLALQDIAVVRHKAFCIGVVHRIVEFGDFPCCRTDEALVIVIIRQRSGCRIKGGIDLILYGKVPRVTVFIQMRVSGIKMSTVVGRAVAADKRVATAEHKFRIGQYRACVPIVATPNGPQTGTILEHPAHIRNIGRIEQTEVKRRKVRTI